MIRCVTMASNIRYFALQFFISLFLISCVKRVAYRQFQEVFEGNSSSSTLIDCDIESPNGQTTPTFTTFLEKAPSPNSRQKWTGRINTDRPEIWVDVEVTTVPKSFRLELVENGEVIDTHKVEKRAVDHLPLYTAKVRHPDIGEVYCKVRQVQLPTKTVELVKEIHQLKLELGALNAKYDLWSKGSVQYEVRADIFDIDNTISTIQEELSKKENQLTRILNESYPAAISSLLMFLSDDEIKRLAEQEMHRLHFELTNMIFLELFQNALIQSYVDSINQLAVEHNIENIPAEIKETLENVGETSSIYETQQNALTNLRSRLRGIIDRAQEIGQTDGAEFREEEETEEKPETN